MTIFGRQLPILWVVIVLFTLGLRQLPEPCQRAAHAPVGAGRCMACSPACSCHGQETETGMLTACEHEAHHDACCAPSPKESCCAAKPVGPRGLHFALPRLAPPALLAAQVTVIGEPTWRAPPAPPAEERPLGVARTLFRPPIG